MTKQQIEKDIQKERNIKQFKKECFIDYLVNRDTHYIVFDFNAKKFIALVPNKLSDKELIKEYNLPEKNDFECFSYKELNNFDKLNIDLIMIDHYQVDTDDKFWNEERFREKAKAFELLGAMRKGDIE